MTEQKRALPKLVIIIHLYEAQLTLPAPGKVNEANWTCLVFLEEVSLCHPTSSLNSE